jgi:hypothetical protein
VENLDGVLYAEKRRTTIASQIEFLSAHLTAKINH